MPKPVRGQFTPPQLREIIDLIGSDFSAAVVRSYEILWPGWPDSAPPGRIGVTIPDDQHVQIRTAAGALGPGWDQLGPPAASSVPDPKDEKTPPGQLKVSVNDAGRDLSARGVPSEAAAAIIKPVRPPDTPGKAAK